MALDMAPRCPLVRQHKQACDGASRPAKSFARNLRREPRLRVMPAKRLLDRGELGLDLDDEERRAIGVPCKQVDGSSFAVLGERDLWNDLPAQLAKDRSKALAELGVTSIEEPIDLTAAPSDVEHYLGIEYGEDTSEAPDRDAIDAPALHPRYDVLAGAGTTTDLSLRDGQAMPKDANDSPEPQLIHGRQTSRASALRMDTVAYPPVHAD